MKDNRKKSHSQPPSLARTAKDCQVKGRLGLRLNHTQPRGCSAIGESSTSVDHDINREIGLLPSSASCQPGPSGKK